MKVLVAVDSSECSAEAAESMSSWKWPPDTLFRVITVIEPIHFEFGIPAPYTAYMDKAEQEMTEHCQQLVKTFADEIAGKTGCRTEHAVAGGLIASTIIDEAKQWNADLIVLGSHGRRGFQKFYLGSIAERVASCAPCSVQITKTKSAKSRESKSQQKSASTVGVGAGSRS